MSFTPVIFTRESGATNSRIGRSPPLRYEVNTYAWHSVGGPDSASITAYGSEIALWELVNCLRCPVEIRNRHGEPVWWGYIHEVRIRVDSIEVGVSLDTMYNSVVVVYSLTDGSTSSIGTRATTAATTNADSIADYGTKELRYSGSGMSSTDATNLRDTLLSIHKYPIALPGETGNTQESFSATIECKGWWHTLDWQHYSAAAASNVSNTTQITSIVTAKAQFLAGTDIEAGFSVNSTKPYRDGDNTARKEIEDLLKRGSTNNRRLLVTVKSNRRLSVYEEPAGGSNEYLVQKSGAVLTPHGAQLAEGACVAGVWAKLKDVIPANVSSTVISNPGVFFIESSSFDPAAMRLRLQPRGVPEPYQILQTERNV
jgi:hypothetical protein